jgi:sulfite reductase alpha subunit-like flavoprotein
MHERDAARKAGEKVGPMTYLFGSRNKKNDFLYEDELMAYK